MSINLTSQHSQALKLHLEALVNYIKSAFALSDRADYYSSIIGDRFGISDPNSIQLDPERRSSPNCLFCILRSDILLALVYSSEQEANESTAQEMLNFSNAVASFKKLPQAQAYGIIYDVVFDQKAGLRRSLRQNIDAPNVWVADITGTILTKFIIPLYPDGTHRPISC